MALRIIAEALLGLGLIWISAARAQDIRIAVAGSMIKLTAVRPKGVLRFRVVVDWILTEAKARESRLKDEVRGLISAIGSSPGDSAGP